MDRGRFFYSFLRDSPVPVERQGVASDHLGSRFDVLHSVHHFSCCEIQEMKRMKGWRKA